MEHTSVDVGGIHPPENVVDIAEMVGAAKALRLAARTNDVTSITFLKKIYNLFKSDKRHEIRQYYPNFKAVCERFGVNYTSTMEEIHTIDALGEEFYDALKSLGMSRDIFREVRKLPEGERDDVKLILESPGSADAETIKDVIENLIDEKKQLAAEIRERDRNLERGHRQLEKERKEKEAIRRRVEQLEESRYPLTDDDRGFDTFLSQLDGSIMSIEMSISENWERHKERRDRRIRLNALLRGYIATLQKVEAEQAKELGEDVVFAEVEQFRVAAELYFNAAHNLTKDDT